MSDIDQITGQKPDLLDDLNAGSAGVAILAGTLGSSAIIDHMVAEGKIDVSEIEGDWERFIIEPQKNGPQSLILVVGSDRRGTAYGILELSRKIGVSPWVWWADSTPEKSENLHIALDRIVSQKTICSLPGNFLK